MNKTTESPAVSGVGSTDLFAVSFAGGDDAECYECAGCGGEVPIVDAQWLPESRHWRLPARPYCCHACYAANNMLSGAAKD